MALSVNAHAHETLSQWFLRRLTPNDIQQISSLLQSVKKFSVSTRVDLAARALRIGEVLKGSEFRLNPIGEGLGSFDSDPPLNLQSFDCMTFVETVISLARSTNIQQFSEEIMLLRYSGDKAAFASRRHFVATDWLPAAIERSVLYVPREYRAMQASVHSNRAEWYRRLRTNPMYKNNFANENSSDFIAIQSIGKGGDSNDVAVIHYVPCNEILKPGLLREGLVIALLRPNSPLNQKSGGGEQVGHMGFISRGHGLWKLRAASQIRGEVIDIPLRSVLLNSKAPPYGAALLEILPRK